MIFGLLVTCYVLIAVLLILLIMIQKSKGSTGVGALGGHTQMIFGSSGGQDVFQKATWILGAIIMLSSLTLSILNERYHHSVKYAGPQQTQNQS